MSGGTGNPPLYEQQDGVLYLEQNGLLSVVDNVDQISESLVPIAVGLAPQQDAGQDVFGNETLASVVADFRSAWSAENKVDVDALDETARKMRESLDRYLATDGQGAQAISVRKAGGP
jgi:hypothetical protein